ncbi:hypothetical protein HK405_001688 [Cladochytrium tenue]|nr:hypothetical protein HK405_001688 [Cladochytrium tenue]
MLQSQQPLQPAPQAPHQQQLPTGATTPLALDAPLLQLRRHTLPHPLQPSTTEILLRLAADDDHTSPGFDFASHLHHAALGGQLPAPGAQATRNPFHLHIPGSASVVSPLPSPASGASSVFTGASSAASSAFPATASSPGGSSTASSPTPTPEAAAAAAAGGARGRRSTWTAGGGSGGPMSLAPAQGRRSGPAPPMMCPVEGCGRTFNKGLNLRSHIKTHAAERVYACGVCGGTFRRSHDLRRHEASLHTPGGERAFPCGRCPKSFSRLDALKRHVSRPRSRCFIDLADGGMQQLQAILRARGLNVD